MKQQKEILSRHEMVSKLKKETEVGYIICLRAIDLYPNDYEEAKRYCIIQRSII